MTWYTSTITIGTLSAVVDWEACRPGDRAFDLMTFWFGLTHADDGVGDRIWARAAELTSHEALAAYGAHMSLRRLDWTLRHHHERDVEAVLGMIENAVRTFLAPTRPGGVELSVPTHHCRVANEIRSKGSRRNT